MPDFLQVKNNAASILNSAITAGATSLTVAAGEGARFPTSNFHITIDNEILKCTTRTGDVLTVTRAQEGTVAAAHDAAKAVRLNITAEIISEIQNRIYNQMCTVYHSVHQSIPNATHTILAFNSEDYDTNTMHDLVTNNSRITIKETGYYLVWLQVRFAANATGVRIVSVKQNGAFAFPIVWLPVGVAEDEMCASRISAANVNDYFEVSVLQSSGGALNCECGAAQLYTRFGVVRIQ